MKFKKIPTLLMTVAIPGAGKSTWIREFNQKGRLGMSQGRWKVVEPDGIRREITGDVSDISRDKLVWKIAHDRVKNYLREGYNVILDATNINVTRRGKFLQGLPQIKLQAKVLRINSKQAKLRIKNDLASGKDRSRVPPEIVDHMFEKFENSVKFLGLQGFDIIK